MSRTWKWILGIVLGLIVLAGIGFVATSYFGFGHMAFWGGPAYYGHPMMNGNGYGFGNRGPGEGFRDFHQPMMGGRGFYPFGGFFFLGGLLRLVLPLGLLALVAFAFYQWGKRAGMNAVLSTSHPSPAPAPEPKTAPEQEDTSKE